MYKETREVILNLAASGQVVAAVPGHKIRVLGYKLSVLGATNLTFQTGSGASVSGTMYCAATSGYVVPYNDYGWGIETVAGEALNLNMSAATSVGGELIYEVV